MDVEEAIASRRSVRGFTATPVPRDVIERVLQRAARSPSGGNLQPWHIVAVAGAKLEAIKQAMPERIAAKPRGEGPEYDVYPERLADQYAQRRFRVGEMMYDLAGIKRDDRAGRQAWFQRNFQFFGAPVGLFCYIHRDMGPPQWSDLGMYLQNVMLLLRNEGLDSCAQEAWSWYHRTVAEFVNPDPAWMLFCGMAVGEADRSEPVNALITERAGTEQFASFLGWPD